MNEKLEGVTQLELREAFLQLLTQKIHTVIYPVLFPVTPADVFIQEEYSKIAHVISREAAESFFKRVAGVDPNSRHDAQAERYGK